jgi:iron complex outermembrane recepter protein
MRVILISLSLIILFAITGFGAVYNGIVVNDENQPIAGVNVLTNNNAVATITDAEGHFMLNSGDETLSRLTFSHVSFQPEMIHVSGKKDMNKIKIVMQPTVYPGQNIRVTAMRAELRKTPVAFSDFSADQIKRDYTVGDFPILLETTPNLYSFSYTGGLTGASDYKIRGFDSKRIGVYIDGIPLNDPEDRFTYFYDLPDFASEVADIQVQRGVGNSLYGDATFGGSINIASARLERPLNVAVTTGFGQFFADNKAVSDIRKQAVEFSSGLIAGRWSMAGRYSKLYSGGYREYAWYDGWAYFFSLSRVDPKMTTTLNMYGGPMKAHQAWYGIDRGTEEVDRRTNWTPYENEIDNFNQPHYEIHNTYKLNDNMMLKNTLYYIKGVGYYEESRTDSIRFYDIPVSALIDTTEQEIDLIRQKWVKKNQYGWNPRLDWEHKNGTAILGGSFYYFDSDHYGLLVRGTNLNGTVDPLHKYYQYYGKKYSSSIYALEYYSLSDKIRLMGNVQLRYLAYDFNQDKIGALAGYKYNVDWLFLSPRAGITYLPNENLETYFSFAVSSREPDDKSLYDAEDVHSFPQLQIESISTSGSETIYTFGQPIAKPERLYDFELGSNYKNDKYKIGINLFWMEFRNEIIADGGLDESGRPLLGNAERSVHSGVELSGAVNLLNHLNISANASYNYDRLKKYISYVDTTGDGIPDTLDFSGNPTAGFPEYLGNLILDYKWKPLRFTYRLQAVGKQYVDYMGNEEQAIEPYQVSSVSASWNLGKASGFGKFTLSARVDNLFNKKYELSGYAYWYADYQTWAYEYYPAAERSFYAQLKWEIE